MKRLFFVALALVVLAVVPVSAYDLIHEYSGNDDGTFLAGEVLYFDSNENRTLITRFEWDGPCQFNSDRWIENVSIPDARVSGDYANISFEFSSVGHTKNEYTDCSIDINFFNVNGDATALTPFFLENQTKLLTGLFAERTTDITVRPWIKMGSSSIGWEGTYKLYNGTDVTAPEASFTCTPTSQFPGDPVVCTDTSTNTPDDWYWTIDAESWGIDNWQTSTSQNFTWYSAYSGIFSVNLRANNSAGSDWENKSSYVSISQNATPNNCNVPPLPGLIRSMAQCVDSQTSGAIAGCDLSLYDLEGGSWSNVTDRFDGTWCIDTYPSHHFHAYGSADDYTPDPTYRLNLPVSSSVVYELLMHPGYVPAAADGKVWLYVIVNDADTGASLSDAHVSISGSGQTTKSDVTDSTGSIHIQWVNASTAYVTASKAGYTSGSKTVTTSDYGPDTLRIELHRSTVLPTATATTGAGGTVPTTAGPWGTPGPYGTMPSGYTNAQGQMAMDYLAANGLMLVQLCVLVTICALLGFKFGK